MSSGTLRDLPRRKRDLRASMRSLRDAVPAAERARLSLRVADRLLELDPIRSGRSVLLFYAFGSEVETSGIIRALSGQGSTVLLPAVDGDRLRASPYRPGDGLIEGTYGIPEPPGNMEVPAGAIDVVVAPGLAFDREGNRLGYGGGFFDRLLSEVQPDAPRIGIGFHFQLVDRVPHGPDDQPLTMVVTDSETIVASSG
jgi:5-formyltetrahydrofolate cyclo-ligase